MSLTKEQKAVQIESIVNLTKECKSFVIVSYKGINVADDTAMRAKFRQAGVTYKVLKNRLIKKALDELGIKGYDEVLTESTAVAFSMTDPLAGPKVIAETCKTVKAIEVKCGRMAGDYLDAAQVQALAQIPSKEVLVAKLLGLLLSPISGLAVALDQVAKKNA
ncbi:MAG: 50S ribosomal protein L10 [Clostridia bacterium]|nr:50S ribosomal protein L10 [Clostridia bacterium]